MKSSVPAIFCGLLFSFHQTVGYCQVTPVNDNFADRIVLSGNAITFSGSLSNATIEPSEVLPAVSPILDASVWWSWTAAQSQEATLELLDFAQNEIKSGGFAVWSGNDFTNLNSVAKSSLNSGRHPFLNFPVSAGTTYHIQVIGPKYGEFTLRLTETNAPMIMVQPMSRTVFTNGSVFFGVVVSGQPPLFYQWRFNGTNMAGENFPILSFDHLTANQSGQYSVIISNSTGASTSQVANLNVASEAAAPELSGISGSDRGFEFQIRGDAYTYYRIESSTNLIDWASDESFPAGFSYLREQPKTDVVLNRGQSFPTGLESGQKFYRAKIYAAPNEICVNNLNQIRFAQELWTLQNGLSGETSLMYDGSDLVPYFKNGFPLCPLYGGHCVPCSYVLQSADKNPVCAISVEHVLEQPEY